MNHPGYFITGISTGVGKTVAAAVVAQALGYDYWKPLQCGDLDASDSATVAALAPGVRIHAEAYRFALPASPHRAAAEAGQEIALERLIKPRSEHLIVEGAGGLLVPLNDRHLIIDLIAQLALPTIVVSRHYLGSINHTLLTLTALKARGLAVAGVIFVGPEDPATEQVIVGFSSVRVLGHLPVAPVVDQAWVESMAQQRGWHELR